MSSTDFMVTVDRHSNGPSHPNSIQQWTRANRENLTCIGTVDSYDRGQVAFFTQVASTGDVEDSSPSVTRTMAIALLQTMDQAKIADAFHALAQVELGEDDLEIFLPDHCGAPIALYAAVGEHGPVPFELEDD